MSDWKTVFALALLLALIIYRAIRPRRLRVFILFDELDRPLAQRIKAHLSACEKLDAFMDSDFICNGDHIHRSTARAIDQTRHIVVIDSETARGCDSLRALIEGIDERRKVVHPVRARTILIAEREPFKRLDGLKATEETDDFDQLKTSILRDKSLYEKGEAFAKRLFNPSLASAT